MLVSIVIPCFNSEKTIIRALLSVVKQTYKHYEIIIVDDGSTDNTKELVQEFFKDKKTKYQYIYQKNSGPSCARNNGVQNAKGEYIAFLDSDDEWCKDKLKIQIDIMKERNLNFLGSRYQYSSFPNKISTDIHLNKYSFNSLLLKTRFSTPGIIIKKDFFLLFLVFHF